MKELEVEYKVYLLGNGLSNLVIGTIIEISTIGIKLQCYLELKTLFLAW